MIRPICKLITLAAALMPSSILAQQGDLADVIANCERSVVRIEVKGSQDGQGSGFIVESDGLLVTNFHVLAGAEQAVAFFPTGASYPIVGIKLLDPSRDIAIAKIDGQNLPTLSPSRTLPRKGETVVGLGSPLGLSFTATNGIVSAIRTAEEMNREIGDEKRMGTWIQVDAALSPGNSGGPLINAKGEFVAMSTLASSGIAQNINFGISAEDIRSAISTSKARQLDSLAMTTAKVDTKTPKSKKGDGDSLLQKKTVPAAAVESYLTETKNALKTLTKEMGTEKRRLSEQLKEMKAGQDFIPGNVPAQTEIVREHFKKITKWYFRNNGVKQRVIQKADARAKELGSALDMVTKGTPNQAIEALATRFGPRLNPQSEGSVGFMTGATVIQAFTKHDLVIEFDGAPYLMYVDSTAGLFTGQEINPTAVFVAGTSSANVRGTPMTITILQAVEDDEILKHIPGASSAGTRKWRSKDGKFTVEAQLVKATVNEVTLKRSDNGKEITVPVDRLSDEDLQFIKN